ncbi:MAG: hypothetical protein PHR11_03205 [Candidatus Omnitrophica bacterium]|nr:hypothetical protein [Candidatus Omnitrophota bacterium]
MFPILFFTAAGFLAGLAYVMAKKKIRPGALLSSVFLAALVAAVWKVMREVSKNKKRGDFFS